MSGSGVTLEFRDVTWDELLSRSSFRIREGQLAGIICRNRDQERALVRLILGIIPPDSGEVLLFGEEVSALSPPERNRARQRVGVAYSSGGLVANLKVWENVTLPLMYHTSQSAAAIEELGRRALARAGYEGRLMELPGRLSGTDRRRVSLARALVTAPELMIYAGIFEGLSDRESTHFREAAVAFQKESLQRSSLFIAAQPEQLDGVPLDTLIPITDGPRP